MKILKKEFSLVEKLILLGMIVFLIVLMYIYFVDKPVKKGMREAEQIIADCEMLTPALQAKVMQLQEVEYKLDQIKKTDGLLSVLESYNNGEAEMDFMHEVLRNAYSYNISFANATRDGDLIRRNVDITFTADSYEVAKAIIEQFAGCKFRCIVSDVRMANTKVRDGNSAVAVSCNMTFYETMVGGTNDIGIPADDEEE